jgi:hypothetical protein
LLAVLAALSVCCRYDEEKAHTAFCLLAEGLSYERVYASHDLAGGGWSHVSIKHLPLGVPAASHVLQLTQYCLLDELQAELKAAANHWPACQALRNEAAQDAAARASMHHDAAAAAEKQEAGSAEL